jgi:hypothetical protein
LIQSKSEGQAFFHGSKTVRLDGTSTCVGVVVDQGGSVASFGGSPSCSVDVVRILSTQYSGFYVYAGTELYEGDPPEAGRLCDGEIDVVVFTVYARVMVKGKCSGWT